MQVRTWWKAWGELALKIPALAGSLASLIGLVVLFLPSQSKLPRLAFALLIAAAFFFVIYVVLEIFMHRGRRVYAKSDKEGIKRYMHEWIGHSGRVAIWSRDMSWAQNDETRELLREKAARRELIICLPEQNELTMELRAVGAEICAYGADRLESPASRFTIIFFGRDGARVAVGRADGDMHVIDEFSAGSHPAFHLAEDLIALVRAQSKERGAV